MGRKNAGEAKVIDLLNDILDMPIDSKANYEIIIPEYQRPYSWGKEETANLLNKLIENFKADANGEEIILPYIGHVIMQSEHQKEVLNVIDGQQRMTTFLLIFAAFLELLEEYNKNNNSPIDMKCASIQKVINYCFLDYDGKILRFKHQFENRKIINQYVFLRTDLYSEVQLKIIDEEMKKKYTYANQEEMLNLFHNNFKNDERRKILYTTYKSSRKPKFALKKNYGKIVESYDEILKILRENWRNIYPYPKFAQLLGHAELTYKVDSSFQRAFEIFTSLNSTGMKLTHLDLIKSSTLSKYKDAINDSDYDVANKRWTDIFENSNRDLEVSAITDIFRAYLKIEHELYEINSNNLYSEYDKITNPSNIEHVLDTLERYVQIYENCFSANFHSNFDDINLNSRAKAYDENIQLLFKSNFVSTIPLVYYTVLKESNWDKIKRNLDAAIWSPISFYTLGLDRPEALEKLLVDIPKLDTTENQNLHISRNFKTSEEDIKRNLQKKVLPNAGKYILQLLDTKSFSGSTQSVHLEHIIPSTPKSQTKVEFNEFVKSDYFDKDDYEDFVNQLGNYLLLSYSQNQKVKNKGYDFKYSKYKEFVGNKEEELTSSVFDDFMDSYGENFNFDSVIERTQYLSSLFMEELKSKNILNEKDEDVKKK